MLTKGLTYIVMLLVEKKGVCVIDKISVLAIMTVASIEAIRQHVFHLAQEKIIHPQRKINMTNLPGEAILNA